MRLGADARVGRVHAVDVRINLAEVGLDGGGQGHSRRVGAAAAQRGDLTGGVHALEARHNDDVALVEVALDAVHAHDAVDLGAGMRGVRHDAHLRARVAHGRHAQGLDGHGEHGNRDLLAGGQEHVHLTCRRVGVDGMGQVEQVVGVVSHCRDNRDDLIARLVAADQLPGDVLHALGSGHGAAAELSDDECHGLGLSTVAVVRYEAAKQKST